MNKRQRKKKAKTKTSAFFRYSKPKYVEIYEYWVKEPPNHIWRSTSDSIYVGIQDDAICEHCGMRWDEFHVGYKIPRKVAYYGETNIPITLDENENAKKEIH